MIMDGVNKTSITIYNPNGKSYNRTVINNCIWKPSKKTEMRNQGVIVIDAINIYIPYNPEYTEATRRAGNIRLGNEKKVSYIVKGVCPFNFSQSEVDRDIQDSIREFEKTIDYHKAISVRENTMGRKDIWHVKVVV